MGVILVSLIFLALVLAWIFLPFIPAVREWKQRKDADPVRVARESEVDIRFLARGFQAFLKENLAEAMESCSRDGVGSQGTLEDETEYIILDGRAEQEPDAGGAVEPSNALIASCGRLRLPGETEYMLELYAADTVEGGENNTYRAILADDSVNLGSGSTTLRWVHGGKSVRAADDCRLWGRVSADDSIELDDRCRFERLSAPTIRFGETAGNGEPVPERTPLLPGDLPRLVDEGAGRWLINGKLEIPDSRSVETNLVATGEGHVGEHVRIDGSVKTRKDLHLGPGVEVYGSVVSGRTVYLGEGCRIHGPVLAEEVVVIRRGCVIGSADCLTTVSARRAEVEPGSVVHGTFWAHEEGIVTANPGEEG